MAHKDKKEKKNDVQIHEDKYVHISKKLAFIFAPIYVPLWLGFNFIVLFFCFLIKTFILCLITFFGLFSKDWFAFTYLPDFDGVHSYEALNSGFFDDEKYEVKLRAKIKEKK
jgi:hypothetical protein